jgi:hypothetical protein
MTVQSKNPVVLSLVALLLGLLFLPRAASAQQMRYFGCYDHESALGERLAAANFAGFQPNTQRYQACMSFCRTGNAAAGAARVHAEGFRFPAAYSGFRNNDSWCFCGSETVQQPLGLAEVECQYKIAVYQPASSAPPAITPQPAQANQPPLAPTVNPGGWEPPFPLGYEGARQLAWTGNGDPEGDPVTYWIEAWWWNAQQGQWQQFIGEWLNEPYFTLTQARGLVPNVYYTWRVAACDTAKRSQPWYAWSAYSVFRTVP